MARHLKASNALFVESRPVMVEHLSEIILTQHTIVKSNNRQVDMVLNGSGVRDTARVVHVSPSTVIRELEKKNINSNK
jgi:hypothetical protein